ncbi:MAG: hypothetical protein M1550_06220 [Deltaproteobacteria bacterium]|nr:hypothetical protein [Deltaproteobacteria bacterium]
MGLERVNAEAFRGTFLGRLLAEGEFRFDRLEISGIDNHPVFRVNAPDMPEQEICLFQKSVASGDAYVRFIGERVVTGMRERKSVPVVRFADGEYAFYDLSLKCNGLYLQAESVEAIRRALPLHVEALRFIAGTGMIAPLVFPGNVRRRGGLAALLGKRRGDDSAIRFLEFLGKNGIYLTGSNYVPFYAVYAWLSSDAFAKAVDGATVCVVNSDFDGAACEDWFGRAGSRPRIIHAPIPGSCVATQWDAMREEVLRKIPGDADLCLVGAGAGALPACVDIARRSGVPAIDGGHILNMMNALERKSGGPRLYTYRR